MTTDERIAAVSHFGYRPREAAFVVCAALHSGYFLQRQFLQFAGRQRGWCVHDFIEKIQTLRHVNIYSFCGPTLVYHLAAKPLYTAIGEPDNRHRRRRHALGIKGSVMALDYVLAHPDVEFLATERERVAYFTQQRVELERLPGRRYLGQQAGDATIRYFIDKYPIGLTRPRDGQESEPLFAYIDDAAASVAGFETYLTRYGPLVLALPRCRVVFVSESTRLYAAAERAFRQWSSAAANGGVRVSRRQRHANGSIASVDELLAYFRLRYAYETKRYAELTKEALDRLRAWREIFGNPLSESLFDRWQREGDDGVRSATAIASAPVCPAPRFRDQPVRTEGVRFETAVLPHVYATFGPTRLGAVGPLHEPHAHMQRRRRNVCR